MKKILTVSSVFILITGCSTNPSVGNQHAAPMSQSMMSSAAKEAVQNLRAQGVTPMTSEQCSAAYKAGQRQTNGVYEYSPHELCINVANEYYNQPSLQAGSQESGVKPTELVDVNEELEIRAKEAVSRELRDPSSAQFRDIYGVRKINGDGEVSVCGSVNGKNAYGGYVGFKPFAYSNGTVLIAGKAGSLDSDLVKLVCVDGVQ